MNDIRYKCPKCNNDGYETGEFRATGGLLTKIFDVQSRRFTTVTCTRCRYTEIYQASSSMLGNIFDFFTLKIIIPCLFVCYQPCRRGYHCIYYPQIVCAQRSACLGKLYYCIDQSRFYFGGAPAKLYFHFDIFIREVLFCHVDQLGCNYPTL